MNKDIQDKISAVIYNIEQAMRTGTEQMPLLAQDLLEYGIAVHAVQLLLSVPLAVAAYLLIQSAVRLYESPREDLALIRGITGAICVFIATFLFFYNLRELIQIATYPSIWVLKTIGGFFK